MVSPYLFSNLTTFLVIVIKRWWPFVYSSSLLTPSPPSKWSFLQYLLQHRNLLSSGCQPWMLSPWVVRLPPYPPSDAIASMPNFSKLDNMRLSYWRVNKFYDFLAPTSQSWLDQTIANLERYRSRGRRSQNSKTRFRFSICCLESDWKATVVKKSRGQIFGLFHGMVLRK